ncbi:MAG: glycosyltransferase [Christensenellales bacterium]
MNTLSLCMIVKNEEQTIARCLESAVVFADEIIIVDTGSSDNTKRIARRFTRHIYDFNWIDNFSAARNYAFSFATSDLVMWLDADDVVPQEEARKIALLKQRLDDTVHCVMLKYDIAFDLNGKPTFSYYRERIIRRSAPHIWREPVHEYLECAGKSITEDIHIEHRKIKSNEPGRNKRIYESILKKGGELSVRGLYYYARELHENSEYAKAIKYYNKFLDTKKGWVEDNIGACTGIAQCYRTLGDDKKELEYYLKSFQYELPRAEQCCGIAYHYKNLKDYKKAAFWFELALRLEKPKGRAGFIREECWGYVPSIELAVCYSMMGEMDIARKYNEKAGEFKPGDPSVDRNRKFFEARKRFENI